MKGQKRTFRLGKGTRKILLYLAALLLLFAAGRLILNSIKDTDTDEYMNVSVVGRMLIFTDLADGNLAEFLDKDGADKLTYADVNNVLEKLGLDKTIQTEWEESALERNISKEEWLEVYDVITGLLDTEQQISFEIRYLAGDNSVIEQLEEKQVYTDSGVYTYGDFAIQLYFGETVEIIALENEILCVRRSSQEEVVIRNVWIHEVTEKGFVMFADGCYISFEGELAAEAAGKLADIVIEGKNITAIRTKEENINGKILSIQDEGIEIEGYGLIPFAENFRIYSTYSDLKQISKDDLVLGYKQTEFIVAEGRICGGIVVRPFSAENIRVLLKTSGYSAITHNNVTVTPSTDYTITYGDQVREAGAGESVTIDMDSEYWAENRIFIEPKELAGQIAVNSIERSCGTPTYRGTIEVVKTDGGMVLINEVSLEEYLYSVLPSEMPTSYGLEALKAQAVCARSYAYNHLEGNSYAEYGAHVDDSTAFQVYQNYNEDEEAIRAVNETNGQVMTKDGTIINAYYFSTSGGHTTTDAAWGVSESSSFLGGMLVGSEQQELDMRDEGTFANFIKNKDYEAYEKDEVWYRWRFSLSVSQINHVIDSNLGSLSSSKPDHILVKNGEGEYVSTSISSLGSIQNVQVAAREEGGVVSELIISGSDAEIKVTNENVIRTLFGLGDIEIERNDGTRSAGGKLLPSAYFTVEKSESEEQTEFHFYGGGLGHGIGMSQNAAKSMAAQGMSYDEILKFFYNEIEITEYGVQ